MDAGIHAMSRINVSIRMMDVGRIVDLIGSMCEEILRSNSYIADSENYELCVLRVIEPRFTRLKDEQQMISEYEQLILLLSSGIHHSKVLNV